MRTYQIGYYANLPDEHGNIFLNRNWHRIGSSTRNWRRALKLVYWLRRRGVPAFAF